MKASPGTFHLASLALVLVLWLMPDISLGQAAPTNNVLDGIIDLYRTTATSWRGHILDAATRLFWLLVGIDFIWTGINLAIQKADLSQIVSEMIKRIMVIGFYYALLFNSGVWTGAIIDSFRTLASDINTSVSGFSGGISPSNIFDMGIGISAQLLEKVSFSEIGESVGRIFISIIILIAFALITGLLLVALVELYIALNAAVILLAFGGSRWTSDYAIKYMSFVLSSGMKIFVMQLLIGIGQSFILTMNSSYEGTMAQSLILLGVAIVLCMLVKTIPDYIQSIVAGGTPGRSSGNGLVAAASAAGGAALGAAAGAAVVGVGGAMAVMEASKLAQAGGSSGIGRALGTAKNLGSAALGDIGGKMSGNMAHQHGSMGARMASRMKEERLSKAPPKDGNSGSSGTGSESTRQEPNPDIATDTLDQDL